MSDARISTPDHAHVHDTQSRSPRRPRIGHVNHHDLQ